MTVEKITAIAIRHSVTGQIWQSSTGIHADLWVEARALSIKNATATVDGYVTNLRPFVNREDAYIIAKQTLPIRTNRWIGKQLESGEWCDAQCRAARIKERVARFYRKRESRRIFSLVKSKAA